MGLSNDLIKQFVKVTRDQVENKQATTMLGTIKVSDGKTYVQIDGSDLLTPITTTADVKDEDRVTVLIENHTAIVTGNVTDPSASSAVVKEVSGTVTKMDLVLANKVDTEILEAESARINQLVANSVQAEQIRVDKLVADEVAADRAEIAELKAKKADVTELEAESARIDTLETTKLDADVADVKYATIEGLTATDADIYNLKATYAQVVDLKAVVIDVNALKTDKADINFANIDFAEIDKAKLGELYAESGIIKDIITDNGYVTGELVGVTIKGDLIEAGTLKADKLVVKGDDGIFYKLNFESGNFTDSEPVPTEGLHGSVIVANSITAEKVNVSDLVAFDATIGGFNITENSIFSEVKDSEDNTTRGIYMDADGQINFGDTTNFIKYYNDPIYYKVVYDSSTDTFTSTDEVVIVGLADEVLDNEEPRYTFDTGEKVYYDSSTGGADTVYCRKSDNYKLTISAESIMFALNGSHRSIADIGALTEYVKIGTYHNEATDNEEPCIELGEHDSDFKLVITNTRILFKEGAVTPAYINNESLHIEKAVIEEEMRVGGFVWKERANGNMSLTWEVSE